MLLGCRRTCEAPRQRWGRGLLSLLGRQRLGLATAAGGGSSRAPVSVETVEQTVEQLLDFAVGQRAHLPRHLCASAGLGEDDQGAGVHKPAVDSGGSSLRRQRAAAAAGARRLLAAELAAGRGEGLVRPVLRRGCPRAEDVARVTALLGGRAGQSRHALALHEAWLAPTLGPKFFGHAARALQKGVTGAAAGGGTDDLRRPQEGPAAAAAARSICAEKVGLDALRRIERLSGRGLAAGDGSRQQQVKAWRHQSAYVLALARVQLVCPSSCLPVLLHRSSRSSAVGHCPAPRVDATIGAPWLETTATARQ
jgi:hypothetical protein